MKSFLVTCLLTASVDAFNPATRSSNFPTLNRLYSTEPSSSETNSDLFSSPNVIAVESSGDVNIDFDALANESASEASKSISEILSAGKKERRAPRQAQWFPMLLSPTALDGSFAGDVGFDPLGFSNSKESLYRMREAEIKHSRLAMLAVTGWPLSELWHNGLAKAVGMDSLLMSENRAPSILNGGLLNEWIIATAVGTVVLSGALEFITMQASQKANYRPGAIGFDPLGLHSFRSSFKLDQVGVSLSRDEKLSRAKLDMELCEIKHGRLAMIAITGMAGQEFIFGTGVVEQTPFFFGDPIF